MLALLAGRGALPARLKAAQAGTPLVCSMEGFLPDGLTPDVMFRIETLGSLLEELKARGVTQVCFAGAIRRPRVDPMRINAATLPLVPILQKAILAGDDAALRAMLVIFETAGFEVLGAHQVEPGLLPPAGVISKVQPDDRAMRDAERGEQVLAALSHVDVGQACVVQAGQVLAVEGVFGTDWMLDSLKARPDGRTGGLLCKAPKIGQDRRMDMPAIGPDTVQNAHAVGVTGLVLEAGGVMVLDLPAVVAACDAMGLLLWVRRAGAECVPT